MKTVLKLCLILAPSICWGQQPIADGTIFGETFAGEAFVNETFVGATTIVPTYVEGHVGGYVGAIPHESFAPEVVTYGTPPIPQSAYVMSPAQPVTYAPSSSFSSTSFAMAQPFVSNGGGQALSIVNQKRARRGLPALAFDGTLTSVAQRKSQHRANRRMTGHDGSHRGGARVEGVGYAYGGNLPSRFSTCYLYSTGYRYAGAAIAYDTGGRAYYTLLLR